MSFREALSFRQADTDLNSVVDRGPNKGTQNRSFPIRVHLLSGLLAKGVSPDGSPQASDRDRTGYPKEQPAHWDVLANQRFAGRGVDLNRWVRNSSHGSR